jgi:hypothetical protein
VSVKIYLSWGKRVGLLLWENFSVQDGGDEIGSEWIRGESQGEFASRVQAKIREYGNAKVFVI